MDKLPYRSAHNLSHLFEMSAKQNAKRHVVIQKKRKEKRLAVVVLNFWRFISAAEASFLH